MAYAKSSLYVRNEGSLLTVSFCFEVVYSCQLEIQVKQVLEDIMSPFTMDDSNWSIFMLY